MEDKQKRFVVPLVVAVVILLVIGSSAYIYINKEPVNPIACTMEAKQCPDGSYVGRTGPQCEFTECQKTTEETDLILYIQDKEIAATSDCGVTKKVVYRVPKTIAVADASLKILFSEELSKYGIYKSVSIVDGAAKIMLESDNTSQGLPISSLSSCESSHMLSVLRDTLTQNETIKSIELFSPKGIIQF